MNIKVHGNIITFQATESDIREAHTFTYSLPDGYSIKKAIFYPSSITWILNNFEIPITNVTFPPVNGKSPCVIDLLIHSFVKKGDLFILVIKEFGQIPDVNYFSGAFNPILVTGIDGQEYNMIPSGHFK